MNRPTCETCPYFKADDGSYGDECRHSPPQWVWGGHDSDPGIQGWPETEARFWCGQHPDFPAWLEAQREQPCPPSDGPPEEPTLTVAEVRALRRAHAWYRGKDPGTLEESFRYCSACGMGGELYEDGKSCTNRSTVPSCPGTFRRVVPDPEPEAPALKATRIDHPHSMEDSIILQYYGNDISLAQVAALVEAAEAAEGLLSTPGAVTDRVAGVNRSTIRSVLLGLKMSVAPFKSEEGE